MSLLYPIRYSIVHIGGSGAQRSVFAHTLIHAAINSRQFKLALSLIAELKVSQQLSNFHCLRFVLVITNAVE